MIRAAEPAAAAMPEEVAAVAAEEGVAAELPALLALTRRVFPAATVSVFVEDDPEIPNDRHIVLLAAGIDMTVAEALTATETWNRGLFAACPATRAFVFRLDVTGAR